MTQYEKDEVRLSNNVGGEIIAWLRFQVRLMGTYSSSVTIT